MSKSRCAQHLKFGYYQVEMLILECNKERLYILISFRFTLLYSNLQSGFGAMEVTMQKLRYAKINTCFLSGVHADFTELEVSISPGLPSFDIVGLADSTIKESRERVRSAIRSSGFEFPKGRITVSLIPAYIHKSGTSVDLPLAIGILKASGQLQLNKGPVFLYGELSLDGSITTVPGGILRLLSVKEKMIIIIPTEHIREAGMLGIPVYGAETLNDAVSFLNGNKNISKQESLLPAFEEIDDEQDFSILKGQEKAKRAILIAACGFHNILFMGSPGCGKTTAAHILHGILPPLSSDEKRDVLSMKGIAETLTTEDFITQKRPFRYVSRLTTSSALFGGGRDFLPGEISMSRHGILFLDEMAEFPAKVLQLLHQPLEEKKIDFIRYGETISIPAEFLLVGAMNPCRCGNMLEDDHICVCSPMQKKQYQNHISGAVYDRIDLFCEMRRIDPEVLRFCFSRETKKESPALRKKVKDCWDFQSFRCKKMNLPLKRNGETENIPVKEAFNIPESVISCAIEASKKLGLSVRGYFLLLRVARTIADMQEQETLEKQHILEALNFRRK